MYSSVPDHSFDDMLYVLSNIHRRTLLLSLFEAEQDGRREIDVAAYSESVPDVRFAQLYHNHLPKLADYGFINYTDQRTITTGPNFDEISPLLELLHTHRDELLHSWKWVRRGQSQSTQMHKDERSS